MLLVLICFAVSFLVVCMPGEHDQPLVLVRTYVPVGDEDATPSLPLELDTATSLLASVGTRYIVRRMKSSEYVLTMIPSWLDAFREQTRVDSNLADAEISYALKRVNAVPRVGEREAVVNSHPFTYTINNKVMCADDGGRRVFLLVYVHSAPEHFARRANIRATWGDPKHYTPRIMRLVFVLGMANKSRGDVTEALDTENESHNDIIQSSYIDAYRNLTYKAISALKWVTTYCSNAKFVLKTDDDMVVNPFTLMAFLPAEAPVKNIIICRVYEHGIVFRTGYRRLVRRDEYAVEHYPTFCSGSAHIMTTDVAAALYNASYYVRYHWADDVYMTGLLPFKLNNIIFVELSRRYEIYDSDEEIMENIGPNWRQYIFAHIRNFDLSQLAWLKIVGLAAGLLER